jgi:sodium/hydrogen antiporter
MEWTLLIAALAVLAFIAVSGRLEGSPVTAPMVFAALGLALGKQALGWFEPASHGESVKTLAEVTLALVLFADASQIDLPALRRDLGLPARLLGIGLPLAIVAGLAAALAALGSLQWPEALVLAVILAPTDATLGQAVVVLESIPLRVRQALNVESGLNDGLCVPLFLVALAVARAESGAIGSGRALGLLAEQIGFGALAGAVAGSAAAGVTVLAQRHRLVDPAWLPVVPVAGAALAYGGATPFGGSGFIAAFIGGVFFGRLSRRTGLHKRSLIDPLGELSGALTFLVFGAVLLGPALSRLSWTIAIYAVLSLTLVRLVPVALALIGTTARPPTVAFIGWFGPRGLASVVFAILLQDGNHLPHQQLVLTTVFVTVGGSILAHGLTAAPLANRYAAWFESNPRAAPDTS